MCSSDLDDHHLHSLVTFFCESSDVDHHGKFGSEFNHTFNLLCELWFVKFVMSFEISLDNCSISDYLLHVQTLVNELTSIAETVSNSEHLDLILDGLPDEYESSVSLVTS